jgi:hypothetical protein
LKLNNADRDVEKTHYPAPNCPTPKTDLNELLNPQNPNYTVMMALEPYITVKSPVI